MTAAVETMMYEQSETPWHGLGVAVAGLQTSKQAIVAAGLDWRVNVQPLFYEGALNLEKGAPDMLSADSWNGVVRSSDQRLLGVVGGRYTPVQNEEAFGFFDALVGQGQAIYDTAGALSGGKRVFMLAKLPGDIVLPSGVLGDRIARYVCLSNSHDGSGALRMHFTPIRVVCQNTLSMALKAAGKDGISIRHTEGVKNRMEEATRALKVANDYYKGLEAKANTLLSTKFTDSQMKELAESLFTSTGDEVATRTENNRNELISLFTTGKGQSGKVLGTAWAAYNALTEYADWKRSTRTTDGSSEQEARLQANWFGSGRLLKDKGLAKIEEMVAEAA